MAVHLVAPIQSRLVGFRLIQMGCVNPTDWSPMAVNPNRCRTCCVTHFRMGDDLQSRCSLDDRWCCRMADRYLDLRYDFANRSGYVNCSGSSCHWCYRRCSCFPIRWYYPTGSWNSLVGLYCRNRFLIEIGYRNQSCFAIRYHFCWHWMNRGR